MSPKTSLQAAAIVLALQTKWQKVGNFDSAEACNQALLDLRLFASSQALNEAAKKHGPDTSGEVSSRRENLRAEDADCYATDDARLLR